MSNMLESATLKRRTLLGGASVMALAAVTPKAFAQGQTFKIGYVTPSSGSLASFAEADDFIVGQVRDFFKDGIETKNGKVPVEIIVKDNQSNSNTAAEVTRELVTDDQVHLIVVASTPESTVPVSTQAEIEGVPCISSIAPWQPWFVTRQANAGDPSTWQSFKYTYHFFWGLEDVIATFAAMWDQIDTNKQVGGLFPNDADGNAWGDAVNGLPPALSALGYTVNDPGRFQDLTDDFTAQITAFKGNDIVTGVVIPPDFTTFWTQANQQGFKPKAVTVAKGILFPSAVEALGEIGHNLSSEVWWTPTHPYVSSLTGASAKELADAYTAATSKSWTQPIGFVHALFEVAADAVKRADDPFDADSLAAAIGATDLKTIVGPVKFGAEGLPPAVAANVSKTPLAGGQWRRKDDGTFDLVVVENKVAPDVPVASKLEALA